MKIVFSVFVLFVVFLCHTTNAQSFLCDTLNNLNNEISDDCKAQLNVICNNVTLFWQFFDASSKFPNSGLSYSSNKDYGNFDECLNIQYEDFNVGTMKGKYCAYAVGILTPNVPGVPSPFNLKIDAPKNPQTYLKPAKYNLADLQDQKMDNFAVSILSSCVPDACTASEVGHFFIWGRLADIPIANNVSLVTFSNAVPCLTVDSYTEWESGEIAFVTFLAFILLLIVMSTSYDVLLYYSERKVKQPVYLAFSLLTNGRKLLHISRTPNPEQIPCLNGLRFISMMWVICGHGFVAYYSLSIVNLKEVKAAMDDYAIQYGASAPIAVDTFFFLSGFLLTFSYLKASPKMSPIRQIYGIPMMILHRYLRLTPAVAVLYFAGITIYKKMGSGPLWGSVVNVMVDDCKKWWWSFFLYVQNYVNYDHICLNHTWYLSADMQMFILAPIVLIPISMLIKQNRTKIALVATGILTVILVIVPMIPRFVDYSITNTYDTHSRLNDYLIGVMLGIYLRQYKDKPFPFTIIQNAIIWIFVLIVDVGIMYFLMHYVVRNYEHTLDTLFYGLYRPIWCISLAWMVFSCYKGYGGIINWILTRPIFQVGARLSYCMYLLHAVIEEYWVGIIRNKVYWGDYTIFYSWCGHFIVTTLLSFVWTLAFESPMITIEKFIFGGAKKPQTDVNKSKEINEKA